MNPPKRPAGWEDRISECAGRRCCGRSRDAGSRRCPRRSCRCRRPVRRVRVAFASAGSRPPRRVESGQIRRVVGMERRDANSEIASKISAFRAGGCGLRRTRTVRLAGTSRRRRGTDRDSSRGGLPEAAGRKPRTARPRRAARSVLWPAIRAIRRAASTWLVCVFHFCLSPLARR
jgi:hypothetical protein